jgi:glyoxylase-like metal-dependent hydrolase (beta-lactamase superfamily II)
MQRLLALVSAFALCSSASAGSLEVQIIGTNADNLYANLALIKGDKAAVLVDVPFTRAEAYRVLGTVIESGKTLETIFVTHDHPDHWFMLEVFTQEFPNVRVLAAPQVVADIWKSIPFKLKRWGPMLGANGPRHPQAPTELPGGHFELEGHRMEVIGPMQGDHVHSTALWVPDAKVIVGGDLIFNRMHLWFGEVRAEGRNEWLRSLDRLAALGPKVIVAGHRKPGLSDDAQAIEFSRNYIVAFNKAVATSKNSAELRAKIQAQFPDTIDVLNDFLLGNSSKVAMGEMPPWEE